MQIIQDKPNVAIFVSMPIYYNGYMYTRVKLFSITIWCQPHLKLTSAVHWKREHAVFIFLVFLMPDFVYCGFGSIVQVLASGLSLFYTVALNIQLNETVMILFSFLVMIVTNKKCFTVTSWPFYTADQAELRGIIYFNFLNCGEFSLLTICQKISHGNPFIWWLQSAVS